MIRSLFLLITFFWLDLLQAQIPALNSQVQANFEENEYLRYQVSYNFGFIWIDAGTVDFRATKTMFEEKNAYHFLSTGISEKKWEWIYKVRDTFQVYTEVENLKPILFERSTLEGSIYNRDHYQFDFDKKIVVADLNDNNSSFRTETIPITDCTYDILTATYVTRAMDFSTHWVGDTIPIKLIHDGRLFTMPVIFQGKDMLEGIDNKPVHCIKFSAVIDKGTMFRSGEKITVWVTDDANKTPVFIEAKIVVGSIKVYLIEQ
jgi:hypothetical protein